MTVEGTQMSNGSHGILNSKLYPALSIGYRYFFHNWVFALTGNYRRVTFEYSDERKLVSPTHTLWGFDLQVGKRFGRFGAGLGFGEDSKFFYKFLNSSTVDVEIRREKRIYLFFLYDFYRSHQMALTGAISAGINPAQHSDIYDVQTGHAYGGFIRVERTLGSDKGLGLRFFYIHDEYKTKKLDLNATEIGLGFSFSFGWGASK